MRFLSLILLPLLFLPMLGNAQHSKEIELNFDEKCTFCRYSYISDEFEIDPEKTESNSFVGLSAYTLETTVNATLFYRIKTQEGWSNWLKFELFHESALEDRTVFEAKFIEESFNTIQFKAEGKTNKAFVFRLFYPNTNDSRNPDLKTKNNQTAASCSCIQPAFCDRNCWCPDGSCPEDNTPTPTIPTHIIVHHSAGSNQSNDYAAVVAYIWDLHANTNGWDDIGYNWLIDPNGVVYEGRGNGNQGAHFSCMNNNTTGICLLGNFENQAPSNLSVTALKELISWEACDKNIVPDMSSYHNTSLLNLNHISGHRDGNSSSTGCPKGTACPGGMLYSQLPTIITDVANNPCIAGVSVNESVDLLNNVFEVYPNPAKDQIYITYHSVILGEAFILKLLDSKGAIILEREGTINQKDFDLSLEINALSKGIYTLSINVSDTQHSRKFIKR